MSTIIYTLRNDYTWMQSIYKVFLIHVYMSSNGNNKFGIWILGFPFITFGYRAISNLGTHNLHTYVTTNNDTLYLYASTWKCVFKGRINKNFFSIYF